MVEFAGVMKMNQVLQVNGWNAWLDESECEFRGFLHGRSTEPMGLPRAPRPRRSHLTRHGHA